MDAVQFGRWISERRRKYGFRSQLALAEYATRDPLCSKQDITENFLARLEAGVLAYPFRGSVRRRVMALAWLLCNTPRDVKTYYQKAQFAELDASEAEQLDALRRHLLRQHTQKALPLPPRPLQLIGRESIVRELIATLYNMDMGLYAITGLPGVGKSALAFEVAHRLAAHEQGGPGLFLDGIATFTCTGRQGMKGLLSLLHDIIAAFDPSAPVLSTKSSKARSRSETPDETELASTLDRVRLVLADKQALLLFDGVEAQLPLRQALEAVLAQHQSSNAYQRGTRISQAHRVVLTTGCYVPPLGRITHRLHLEPLAADAAVQLFSTLIKRALSLEEINAVEQVSAAVGYLPLAMEAAATAVAVDGIPLSFLAAYTAEHPLDDVLDCRQELRCRLARAFRDFDAPTKKRFALLSTIGVASFALESAAAMRAKAPTGSDNIDPPLTHVANTAADLGQFVRYSLIDLVPAPTGEGASTADQEHMPIHRSARYHMHPLVYAHAVNALKHAQQEEIEEARRNLQAYALMYIERFKEDTLRLEYEYDFLLASLRQAVQSEQHTHVVRLVDGLIPVAVRLPDFEQGRHLFLWGIQASQYLSDRLHEACFLNHFGRLCRHHSHYTLATQAWKDSLDIATTSLKHQHEDVWCPLPHLAHIAHMHNEVDAAVRYTQIYLERCQDTGDPLAIANALYTHAFYTRVRGDSNEAFQSASRALDILSQPGLEEKSSKDQLLRLKAQTEFARVRGDYATSQTNIELTASLIEATGNHYLYADLLLDQACFARQQGRFDDAQELAHRIVNVAKERKLHHFQECGIQMLQQLSEARA